MSISEYDHEKELVVASVSGTPTVSKAQPIYLSGGDDSQTGTGPVVLDWTGINGPSDIAVYDESGNLLDYEIEELDTTNETGVLWVYNDWVRDGTVQAQVAYGNGSEDRSMAGTGSNPWGNTGETPTVVQHLQDSPLAATDSSPNGNDGQVKGVGSLSDGEFGSGAGSFDGVDDKIQDADEATFGSGYSSITLAGWLRTTGSDEVPMGMEEDSNGDNANIYITTAGEARFEVRDGANKPNIVSAAAVNDGSWHFIVGGWDGSEFELFVDGESEGTNTVSNTISDQPWNIGNGGAQVISGGRDYTGDFDEFKVYQSRVTSAWVQAEYDASAKAGQIFFSQNAATSTNGGGETTQGLRSRQDDNRNRVGQNRTRQNKNRRQNNDNRRRIN
jgi:hypothetical protein